MHTMYNTQFEMKQCIISYLYFNTLFFFEKKIIFNNFITIPFIKKKKKLTIFLTSLYYNITIINFNYKQLEY